MDPRSGPRVFVDPDVLFAGSASPSALGSSLVVLRMGEITLIDAVTSPQAIIEAEPHLAATMPAAETPFRLPVERSLRVVPNPDRGLLASYRQIVDPKSLPIVVAAIRERCRWPLTFKCGGFLPGHPDVSILRPAGFVRRVRRRLAHMDALANRTLPTIENGWPMSTGRAWPAPRLCLVERRRRRSAIRLAPPPSHSPTYDPEVFSLLLPVPTARPRRP